MTHMPGTSVKFNEPDEWKSACVQHTGEPLKCRKCKAENVMYRTHESSCGGWEDDQFKCLMCGHEWWVDGIDS